MPKRAGIRRGAKRRSAFSKAGRTKSILQRSAFSKAGRTKSILRRSAFSKAGRTKSILRRSAFSKAGRTKSILRRRAVRCQPRGNPLTRMPRARYEVFSTAKRKAILSTHFAKQFEQRSRFATEESEGVHRRARLSERPSKARDMPKCEAKKMVRSQSVFPTFKSTSKKADFQCFFLKFGTSWHVSRRPPCRDFWGICGEFQLKRGKNGEVFECNQPPQTGSQTIVPVNLRCKNIAFLPHFSTQTGKFWGRKQKIDARCRNRSDTAVLYRDYPMKISPSGDCELKT